MVTERWSGGLGDGDGVAEARSQAATGVSARREGLGQAFRTGHPKEEQSRERAGAPARTTRATLVKGVAVSGLNPKGLLVFLALLPQFTNPH